MNALTTMSTPLTRMHASFDWLAGPRSTLCSVILLIARAYLLCTFFCLGLTELNGWDTTILLFTEEYKVPLSPPALTAALGTLGELVPPSLMLTDIVPRLAAAGPFFVDVVVVVSYWVNLLASAIEPYFVWGMLTAFMATVGPGWLVAQTPWQRRRH